MKKVILLFTAIIAFTTSNAQTTPDSVLQSMTKMQLTSLYLEQITTLAFNSPYTPFTIGVQDSVKTELDIPTSKYIDKKRDTVTEISKAYSNIIKDKLYEIVPYSDKQDIIRAIVFLQEMNSNIKK